MCCVCCRRLGGRQANARHGARRAAQPRPDCRPIDRLPGEGPDRCGRIVAICRASGEDLGAILVREGFAWPFTRYGVDDVDRQEEARVANRGGPSSSLVVRLPIKSP